MKSKIMERFEYKALNFGATSELIEELNKLGGEGWQLVSVCMKNNSYAEDYPWYYFKRTLCE